MNPRWSMAGVWLIDIGGQQITLPKHMEREARLIAAAPDMYDVLSRSGEMFDALEGTTFSNARLLDDYDNVMARIDAL